MYAYEFIYAPESPVIVNIMDPHGKKKLQKTAYSVSLVELVSPVLTACR